MMERFASILADVRYATRQLRRAPGFAATAILVLGLGAGLALAMFTVLDAVLLRPLPYPDGGRLVLIDASVGDGFAPGYTQTTIRELRARTHTLEGVAVLSQGSSPRMLEGPRGHWTVNLVPADPHALNLLRGAPAMGRWFTPNEEQPGAAPVAVLSDEVWRTVFGGDPHIVGRTIRLWSDTLTVVGVMPPRWTYPLGQGMALWTARGVQPETAEGARITETRLLARLRPGVSLEQVQGEVSALVKSIALGSPELAMTQRENGERQPPPVHVAGVQGTLLGKARQRVLLLLGGAVAAIYLIVCLNVTNLLLTRATVRGHEFAVRAALGATRARLLRQFLLETLLLTGVASLLGLGLSALAVKLLWHAIDRQLPFGSLIATNRDVVLVAAAIAVLGAVGTGLLPALGFTRSLRAGAALERGLRNGTQAAGTGRREGRVRDVLALVEIALSLALLSSAGLLFRSLENLGRVPLGFNARHVISTTVVIPQHAYDGRNIDTALYAPLRERLRALPGVVSVGESSVLPMRGEFMVSLSVGLDAHREEHGYADADGRVASPGLTDTLGITMLRGRFFTDADTAVSPIVAVVNGAFARRYLAGADPVGHVLHMGKGREADVRIVGEMGDVKQTRLERATRPEIYLTMAQTQPGTFAYDVMTAFMQLAVRTAGQPEQQVAAMREALHQVAPQAAFGSIKTMDEAVADSYADRSLVGHLVEVFAGVALLVALIGLYGVLSYGVEQRRREIGLRLALGATRGGVVRLVMVRAGVVVGAGLALGCGLAVASSRLLASYLFGVRPQDTGTLLAAAIALAATACAAAYAPARRAAAIDPNEVLRSE